MGAIATLLNENYVSIVQEIGESAVQCSTKGGPTLAVYNINFGSGYRKPGYF